MNKYVSTVLMSAAFANWPMYIPCRCQASEPEPDGRLPQWVQVLRADDPGVPPNDEADRFSANLFAQAALARLTIVSVSRVISHTNALFCEKRQTLALEATGPQLHDFLRNLAESNQVLRVRDLALRPNPERSRLVANVVVVGHYRVKSGGGPQPPELLEAEYQVLNERRHLRHAALDCYTLANENLPSSWTLEALNFERGKRLSLQGQAPADQVRSLEDVRTKLEGTKDHSGEDLFRVAAGEATMRMVQPAMTNFTWSIQLELRPKVVNP